MAMVAGMLLCRKEKGWLCASVINLKYMHISMPFPANQQFKWANPAYSGEHESQLQFLWKFYFYIFYIYFLDSSCNDRLTGWLKSITRFGRFANVNYFLINMFHALPSTLLKLPVVLWDTGVQNNPYLAVFVYFDTV